MRFHTLIIGLAFLVPFPVLAAGFSFIVPAQPLGAGDSFTVGASLDTGDERINAVEGSVRFSPSLSLIGVRLAGSVVPLWVTPPSETQPGVVSFAGVLPGGYQASPAAGESPDPTGNLFTLVFTARKKDNPELSFGLDTTLYRDDGNGTRISLPAEKQIIRIGDSSPVPRTISLMSDTLPPEPFTPSVVSAEPFGQKGRALVFTAQDKDSGILRYELASSYWPHADQAKLLWEEVQSPYFFKEGDTLSYLYIRAVDHQGNTTTALIPPTDFSALAFLATWWMYIVAFIAFAVILSRYLARRSKR